MGTGEEGNRSKQREGQQTTEKSKENSVPTHNTMTTASEVIFPAFGISLK